MNLQRMGTLKEESGSLKTVKFLSMKALPELEVITPDSAATVTELKPILSERKPDVTFEQICIPFADPLKKPVSTEVPKQSIVLEKNNAKKEEPNGNSVCHIINHR